MHINKLTLLLIISTVALIFTRYFMLGRDIVNFDAFHFKNWSYYFMKELEAKNWDSLLVTIQPGAFTIYSNVVGFKILYFLQDKLNLVSVTPHEFELLMHTFQKIPQTTFIVILLFLTTFQISKLFNKKMAILYLIISTFEPMFIAHSRVIQTDMLQALLMFTSILFTIQFVKSNNDKKQIILAGIFAGFSFIQKSPAIILIGIIPLILLINSYSSYKFKVDTLNKIIKPIVIFICVFIITSFLFFPAFWHQPFITLKRLTWDAFLFGVSGVNTENYSNAKYVNSSKISITYLNYIIYRFTDVYLIGLVLSSYYFIKDFKKLRFKKALLFLLTYIFLYTIMLQISEKKFDRYLLVSLVPLTVLSAYGYYLIAEKLLKEKIFVLLFFGILALGTYTYCKWVPDLMGYTNIINQATNKEKVKYDWGTGYYRLGKHLEKTYGRNKSVAIGDPKSLELFYDGQVVDTLNSNELPDIVIKTINDTSSNTEGYIEKERFGIFDEPHFVILEKKN